MPDDNAPATKADLAALKVELLEHIEKSEANLLRLFHNWAKGSETRIKVSSLLDNSFDERLGFIEERLVKSRVSAAGKITQPAFQSPKPAAHWAIFGTL